MTASLFWPVSALATDLHSAHKDAKGGCAACHVETAREGECGPVPGEWKEITQETCTPCHKAPPAPRTESGKTRSGIKFGHGAHKGAAGPCGSCHEVREGVMTMTGSMYACVTCHEAGGRRVACGICHVTNPGAVTATAIGPPAALRSLLPKAAMPGLGHGPGWKREHGKVAVARASTCRECHDDRKCASCHAGTSRRLVYHPGDWTAVHGIAAKKKATDCGACHAYTRFCIGCHQRTGAAAGGGPGVQTRTAHPAGWGSTVRTPSHHSFAAQKDISSCASCHEEGSCTRCHATSGKGGRGHNPHPAGFAADCGSYLSRNEDACFKCHERKELKKKCLPGVQILPPR
ncbi:MAG: hypothetical protein HY897_24180 [Deltaproteobacteria bacterium]|nr:hypothetical protein [Deltaproteobacteria bacterium]